MKYFLAETENWIFNDLNNLKFWIEDDFLGGMLQYLIYIHSCILPSWIVLQIAPMIFRQVLYFLDVQIAFGNCNGEGRRKDRSDVGKLCHFRWIVTLAIAHPRPKEPLLAIYSNWLRLREPRMQSVQDRVGDSNF